MARTLSQALYSRMISMISLVTLLGSIFSPFASLETYAAQTINITMNQAASQSDPAASSPVKFTATFSSAIVPSTFTGGDISFV
jgi:hypothetical protein